VDPVVDVDRPGRRLSPLLIALLVVIGLTAAGFSYVVARRLVAGQASPTSGPTPAPTGSTTPTGAPVPAYARCPDATARALAAAGLDDQLDLMIYVRVQRPEKADAEAWVCRNGDGLLVYQGHELPGPLDVADNAVNTIMLASGIKGDVTFDAGRDRYVGRNPGGTNTTEYIVSRTGLAVRVNGAVRNRFEASDVQPAR
jgi:hypothetical protein